jgi:hypothetical protein
MGTVMERESALMAVTKRILVVSPSWPWPAVAVPIVLYQLET